MAGQGERIALVTGAAGGMGRACARLLGRDHTLVLTDTDSHRLDALAAELGATGIEVAATVTTDISDAGATENLIATAQRCGTLGAVIHTAGLSPSLGESEEIMRVNAKGTTLLLDALERRLHSALAVVIIASMAGHAASPEAEIDALCQDPANDDFPANAKALLERLSGGDNARKASDAAYLYSKRANLLEVQRRAVRWAEHGARINSISPGLVDTAMGRREVETDEGAAKMLALQPLGWVDADAIADAAAFLVSPSSRMITGTDLKVDGGLCAAIFGGRTTTGACAA